MCRDKSGMTPLEMKLEEEHTFYVFLVAKEGYYEVFPYEGSGNAPIYLYKSLKLLLQQYEKACTQ